MKKPIPFGKYLLLDRINVGGMAEVFLGKSFGVEGFERLVAIKKILPTMVEDEEFITMFIDEARIAVQLNHANLVQIYELGKHNENYFISMEYISGRDLRTILDGAKRRDEVLPQGLAVYLAQKVCEGLDYAHRKRDARGQELGIIHRDVSPQNVLVSFDGEVKLIDFGIAKAANRAQKTQAGILKGKFGYMSPELVRGLPIDRRSDIFAVGVCLYEMLTGEKLFVSNSDFSTLEKVRNAEVKPPSKVNRNIPQGLEDVVMKALALYVEERYQWASDMQEDLMRFLLLDGRMYGAKHLAQYMQEVFKQAIETENSVLEQYAQVVAPPELDGASTDTAMPRVTLKADEDEPLGAPPPPEMQASFDDATQVFDPSEHFTPGQGTPAIGDLEDTDAGEKSVSAFQARMRDELGMGSGPDLEGDENLFGGPGADTDCGGMSQPRALMSLEDGDEATDTPIGPGPLAGPLGDPGAASFQGAVGRFAAEIPFSFAEDADNSGPVEEEPPPLVEQATRITSSVLEPPLEMFAAGTPVLSRLPSMPTAGSVGPRRVVGPRVARSPAGRGKRLLITSSVALVALFAVVAGAMTLPGLIAGDRPADLIVQTLPETGIEILVNDRLVATGSPHIERGLPPGEYKVAVRRPGTRDRQDRIVELLPGAQLEVSFSLDPTGSLSDAREGLASGPGDENLKPVVVDAGSGVDTEQPIQQAPKGRVILRSVPRDTVVLHNGDRVGSTPLVVEDLSLNEAHRFVLVRDGYEEETLEIVLTDSNSQQDVTVRLEQQPAAPPPARPKQAQAVAQRRVEQQRQRQAAPTRPTPPQPRPRQEQPPAPQPTGSGGLAASSTPVAQVIVNGRDTGRWTPIPPQNPLELPAGEHEITFRAEDGRTRTMRVTIEPGETKRLLGVSF